MSHWAEIDENNIVLRVLVGDNNEPDEGEAFMNSLGGTWVKTSYNGNIRKNYAGIGYTYDPTNDASTHRNHIHLGLWMQMLSGNHRLLTQPTVLCMNGMKQLLIGRLS
jgi:hypothetical protein